LNKLGGGDHPEIIPVEFGQIPNSGLGEEVVPNLPDIIQYKSVIPGAASILTQEHTLNNFGRGPRDDVIYQI